MTRKFKRKMDFTNGSQGFLNNENIIPGQNITMRNTSIPLEGQALDSNGYPIGNPVLMQPGFDYSFPSATAVQEKVIFQKGGFYDPTLSNYNPLEIDNAELGPFNMNFLNNSSLDYNMPEMTEEEKKMSQEAMLSQEAVLNQEPEVKKVEGDFQFFNPYFGTDLGSASFSLGQSIQGKDTLGTIGSSLKLGTGLARNLLSGIGVQNRENQIAEDYKRQQRDTMTQSNRPTSMQEGGEVSQEQEIMQVVAETLSQGVPPEEVVQGLIENGIDEQTAQQIVEGVIQQMQPQMKKGGIYLDTLKGRKIVDYKFDDKTNEYEVIFE